MENMIKVRAMRAAGIACFFSARELLAHGFLPRQASDIVDALAEAGKIVGGGATYGTFMLAACPPVAGFIAYHSGNGLLNNGKTLFLLLYDECG